jgi:hypothetical protein
MNPSNLSQLRPASRRSMNDSQQQQHMLANLWNSQLSSEQLEEDDDSFRMNSSVEQLVGGDEVDGSQLATVLHGRRKAGRSCGHNASMGRVQDRTHRCLPPQLMARFFDISRNLGLVQISSLIIYFILHLYTYIPTSTGNLLCLLSSI